MLYRGLIHIHSKYSFDSCINFRSILKVIKKYSLNFVILSDHNTIKGAKEFRAYLEKKKVNNVIVPIAAEYNTEFGDIIAVFIKDEIQVQQNFSQIISAVKEQKGIILFPHPYKSHKNIDEIANNVDLIEIFNSRTEDQLNNKALELAKNKNINSYFASDAHLAKNLSNVIVEFESTSSNLKEAIISSNINAVRLKKARWFDIVYSQLIKSIKYKNYSIFLYQIKSIIRLLIRGILFKRIK